MSDLPDLLDLHLRRAESLDPEERKLWKPLNFPYAENPGQEGKPYIVSGYSGGFLEWDYLGGSAISFNKAREAAKVNKLLEGFDYIPTAITGKHGMISGLGCSDQGIEKAYELAHECDPHADLGNETMLNRECTVEAAKLIGLDIDNKWGQKEKTVFTEGIGAPSYEKGALDILKEKQKKKMTIFRTGPHTNFPYDVKYADGMFLLQEKPDYSKPIERKGEWVTKRKGNEEILDGMFYLLETARITPSNCVNVGKAKTEDGRLREMRTLGIGSSPKRSRSMKIALENYKQFNWKKKNVIAASDGFFPAKDNIEYAGDYEIDYIITPGGSKKDEDVIKEANDQGIAMYFLDSSIRFFSH